MTTLETAPQSLAERLDKLNECEREPVSPNQLQSGRRFAGLFAGEHVAATEFVIGALFVQWGASAGDLVLGLLLGNFLAVLSWTFICTPIATRVRLTLYWYARRIIGPGLSIVYNLVNAMLFCCLAAAMIGVSSSAIIEGINRTDWLPDIQHPSLKDTYPNSIGWVLVVTLVGAVTVTLAILGFKKLSQFASVCAPWMFLIFIAGAVASLPKLGEIHNFSDLRKVAETRIWTGRPFEAHAATITRDEAYEQGVIGLAQAMKREGLISQQDIPSFGRQLPHFVDHEDGQGKYMELTVAGKTFWLRNQGDEQVVVSEMRERLRFWHLVFFAWFCNLATHIGLSDMALFRYAKHWSYGLYSAFGMYLGHFLAWLCAGVMGAAAAVQLNPGEMADVAVGWAGVLAVLLAGWTTTNPTIYRAGLSLQIVTANWPRWKITLVAGAITTCVAFFPAIFMKLLDFVAIYGLMLMPIGAVVFAEHWIFPRIGLVPYWADKRKLTMNPAALISWLVVLVLCFPIEQFTGGRVRCPMDLLGLHLFFRWLPGWFIALGLYVLCSAVMGARPRGGESVRDTALQPALVGTTTAAHERGLADMSMLGWLAGALCVFALAVCLYLPLTVFLGGAEPLTYAANVAFYKKWMVVATVVYFFGAIIWAHEREKLQAASSRV